MEEKLQQIADKLALNDNDTLELIHEEIYQQDFSVLNLLEGDKVLYYPGKRRAAEPGYMDHIIDHIDVRSQNVIVRQEVGGKGHAYWAIKFRRKKYQSGLFHVKIYITRRKKFAKEIGNWRTQEVMLKRILEDYRSDLDDFKLLENQAEIQETFYELVISEVYVHDHSCSAIRLEDFYLERRQELKDLESDVKVLVPSSKEADTDSSETSVSPGDFNYSVLLLGKTQAGKSTFVQLVKKYVDPDYEIDWSKVGNHVMSKTGKIEQFVVKSDLPSYEVFYKDSSATINIQDLSQKSEDKHDYAEEISNRKTKFRPAPREPQSPSPEPVTIRFVDTPGINDTYRRDVEHSRSIIDQMVGPRSFNLIVVIVNYLLALHKEQQAAFDYYSRIIHALQGNHSNVVFLYTHVKYAE
ncbi:hypothetical protein CPB97_005137, partial [Podila verticillata]